MTATNHTVTGAVIGAAIGNPWLALPAAFFSHFLIDMLPHYQLGDHKSKSFLYKLLTDMAMASSFLLVLLIMQPDNLALIFACSVVAASPDLLWFPYWVKELQRRPKPFSRPAQFLVDIQREHSWGLFVELPWFVTMLYLFFQLTA